MEHDQQLQLIDGVNEKEFDAMIFQFPNINNTKPFYDPKDYPELKFVEEHYQEIKQEFCALDLEAPYFASPGLSFPYKLTQQKWKNYWFFQNGEWNKWNCFFCQKTTAVLQKISRLTREVLFSVLAPGTEIPFHRGNVNTSLRCQLGITGLSNCSITVGGVVRHQEPGKLLIFDDFLLHSARNDSSEYRAVLIFDVIHPDLTLEQYDKYDDHMQKKIQDTELGKKLNKEARSNIGQF